MAQVAFGQTVGAIAQGVDGLDSVGPGGIYPLEGPSGQDQGQGHGDRRETDQPVQLCPAVIARQAIEPQPDTPLHSRAKARGRSA